MADVEFVPDDRDVEAARTPHRVKRGPVIGLSVVFIAALAALLILHRSSVPKPGLSAADIQTAASVREWVADSRTSLLTSVSSSSRGECKSVDPQRTPVEVSQRALNTLTGFSARTTIESIDQVGQLCAFEASVVDPGGTVVLVQGDVRSDVTAVSARLGPGRGLVTSDGVTRGYVERLGTSGPVVIAWSGPTADSPTVAQMSALLSTAVIAW